MARTSITKTSIVHPKLELTDPNPEIIELFHQLNKDYFKGEIKSVSLKWNNRMTKSAGICKYLGKRNGCEIHLSVPLLMFRSRKDLITTLLHEMIHAFLFIVDGNAEREEHGPKFMQLVEEINKKTGCHITVHHDFQDEMAYFDHVWVCSGSCHDEPKFKNSIVKKTKNVTPCEKDYWWAEHQKLCEGTFHKISEPIWKPRGLASKNSKQNMK